MVVSDRDIWLRTVFRDQVIQVIWDTACQLLFDMISVVNHDQLPRPSTVSACIGWTPGARWSRLHQNPSYATLTVRINRHIVGRCAYLTRITLIVLNVTLNEPTKINTCFSCFFTMIGWTYGFFSLLRAMVFSARWSTAPALPEGGQQT